MPRKATPAPSLMQLRKRHKNRSNVTPKKKPTIEKKTRARAPKANPPQAKQEANEDSVPSENGERKSNEVPAAGENETKSE
ncbi:non-histone chromosomal protein HMG-14-like isoform X2 [Narcine bancroftii]|uniref:non-histone chromosomal protein HMG-14-like isoform X2 n=1 Tax=Narcine bancroftii TaxID=1343680 RepID=UPI0038311DDE